MSGDTGDRPNGTDPAGRARGADAFGAGMGDHGDRTDTAGGESVAAGPAGVERPAALVNLREFEAAAWERLDPVFYDYFAGGAADEITLAANEAAFRRRALIPRVLRGQGPPRLGVTLLGQEASMPVLLAPTAFHRLAHPDAERATARAAAEAGVIMIAAMLSTVTIEEIAACGPRLWFQLYIQPDLEFTASLVRRAEAAGCRALVVTADSPALGRNERAERHGFHDLPPGMYCANMAEGGHVRQVALSPEISWRHVDRLREMTSLPIVIKGVLHPGDARLAVEHGADAIIVSNHGGRQLDTTPASLDRLAPVAEAVDGRVPLLLDGGIRRGTDVVKALALGAAAVAIGRPTLWGLAVGGQAGVARVLALLRRELAGTLALCGAATPGEVTADLVEEVASLR
ncbi:alpha-hydroxy-acid oxidizing enzyme [Sphaerisporangium melleum]|uniref:Alpha-hydroxy-acid oxidizing enzyme n=1 Tax=Sphaerisporangium melleum TaxID=321316 RepID=A0A917VW70_9ACTN|nr:alpha-hydroxy acid oxidase [Sphaerisporangium melleum]GGL20382.1 alpha-hydroxy-acid oxidizing enzyme [Sphaerisporangium melleum]GII74852.1 alpha-hydroxy-acid oxidizing enzyme [Sphaerisporangium melleum]